MSAAQDRLQAFIDEWRAPLETRALVRFEAGEVPAEPLTPAARADAFTARFGFKSIGFDWEMLDPSPDLTAPRSARATLVEALAQDFAQPGTKWLGEASARQCAEDLLRPFDPGRLSVLTNHLNGLWWPISGAADEWSFVAMDEAAIALLVLVPRG
jgi:hypothetical protein